MSNVKNKLLNNIIDFVIILLGTGSFAISVRVFTAPNQIAPGGVTGISTILNYLTSFPLGTISLIINIPLLIIGMKFLGRKFMIKTLISTVFFTIFSDVIFIHLPTYSGDRILAAIFGGVLTGVGMGVIFMRGGSTGGTDISNRIIQRKFPHIKLGKMIFIVDLFIMFLAMIVFRNLESVLYAIITIFVETRVIDYILYGLESGKTIMVITKMPKEVTDTITTKMRRGCTIINAKGGYSGEDRSILLCAVRNNEFYKLKRIVYSIDDTAFLIVTDATEVVGEGFKAID